MSAPARVATNERLAQLSAEVIAVLHEVLERHHVTEQEWLAALGFLTEVGRQDEFVLLSDVTRTSVLIDALTHNAQDAEATASDVEGPMYREDPPWRERPVKVYEDYDGMGEGDVLFVAGRVTSTDGAPLADAVIDVWQTGPAGGYDLWDPSQPAYNFRGRFGVEESGAYEFQTMLPRPYTVPTDGPVGRYLEMVGQHPWRPAHIHFKIEAGGHQRLVTQLFFPDDPYLDQDTIGAVKPALVRPVTRHEDERERAQRGLDAPFCTCAFDIRLRPGAARLSGVRFASCAHEGRRFAALVEDDVVRPLRGIAELGRDTPCELLGDPPLSDERVPLDEVTLRPVVPAPGKIICMGLNYREHVAEGTYEVPDYPVLFSKFTDTLIAAGEPIVLPPESDAVDYEAELAFVVGRPLRRASGPWVMNAIAGYTIANDVTMRDYQYRTHQWLPGKNWARSTPLGPFLVTPEEVGDPHELDISLELNGERRQSANTRQLIFDLPAIIAAISEFVALSPGDVVLTGTPSGVGYRREPKVLLRDGDSVVIEIERVGRLENPVVGE